MRHVYLIAYDIADPKRWRTVHRLMLGAGDPLQYSVFRCELSRVERILLLERLTPVINHKEDRIMVVDLGPRDTVLEPVEFFGASPLTMPERGPVIV